MDEKSKLLNHINFEALNQINELQHSVEARAANLLNGFEPHNDPTISVSGDVQKVVGDTPWRSVCASKSYEPFTRGGIDYECRVISLAKTPGFSPQIYLLTVSRPSQLHLEAAHVVIAFRMPAEGSPTLDDPGLFVEGFPDQLVRCDDTEKVQEGYEEFEKAVKHDQGVGESGEEQPTDLERILIEELYLGVSSYDNLKSSGIQSLGDLVSKKRSELKQIAKLTIEEIEEVEVGLAAIGYRLRKYDDELEFDQSRSIKDLVLNEQTEQVLNNAGIKTVSDITSKDMRELSSIPGMSDSSAHHIIRALLWAGLHLSRPKI